MGKNQKHLGIVGWAALAMASATSFGLTYSLDHYREAMGSTESQRKTAAERIATLRKLMETEKLVFGAANDPNGPFKKFDAGTDTGSKESVSVIYKSFLEKEIAALRESERRNRPPTFVPGDNRKEQQATIDGLRKKYCDEKLTDKLAQLANEISSMTSRRGGSNVAPALQARAKELNEARKKLLADYLNGLNLTKAIGELVDVVFIDGHVQTLWFAPKENPQARTPVSLSSLINFRTDFDKYFIVIQGCFVSYLNERAEDKRPGKESKELLAAVRPLAQELYDGSLGVHAIYSRLTKVQLQSLIDLFLQLRANDIPTDEEMSPEPLEKWDPSKNPSIVTYIESRLAKDPAKDKNILLADYRYYRLLHRQLYDLEDYLNEEKSPRGKEIK